MEALQRVAEGQYTTVVYTMISEQKYAEVRPILEDQLRRFPTSRAALSLLGYVTYQQQDFATSAKQYESLVREYPMVTEYKLNLAQSLMRAGLYNEALRACLTIDDPSYAARVTKLQATIRYEQEDLAGTRSILDGAQQDDPEIVVAQACLQFKEGKYEQASHLFTDASASLGTMPYLSYNIALCHYRMGQFANARKSILEIIEKGIRDHPELGSYSEEPMVRSVGNSAVLHETALIEAFNLKAAIEFTTKNVDAAKESLNDMPPRNEEELDPKLRFLMTLMPPPPETFGNLLLLYCQYGYYDVAADTLADNPHFRNKYLDQELFDFLEALIMQQVSPEEAYRKFEELAKKHVDRLRKNAKMVQDARATRDANEIKQAMKLYEEAEERYIPVLMAQAKLYWDVKNYAAVERIFRQAMEFCSEHKVWRLNVAHVLFMQETRFKEAIRYYEPIVQQNIDNILSVQAIVLANLCVAYIMTSQNESAEELMRKIEKEEETAMAENPDQKTLSLCIVNLVIGTLYCSKGNYEFGISRVMKSLEDFQKKLDTDTWFYAKLCFLALAETLAKHMIILKDTTYQEILSFLNSCDVYGRTIPAAAAVPSVDGTHAIEPNTISLEARLLYKMFLLLKDGC
eukprot:m51a1_g11311 putative tetratricopeptide repeat protein 30a-like (630) ;mRNA; f:91431-94054